jgi:alpha-D-ribose 1-methylphosphonate 5-triphosphate synthase subunit PhnG
VDSPLAEGLAAAARTHRDDLLALGEHIAESRTVDLHTAPAPQSVLVELAGPIGVSGLGEAIVTTTSVSVDGRPGWSCVFGWDDAGSLAAALCEAVADEAVRALAEQALDTEAEAAEAKAAAVALTKVGA